MPSGASARVRTSSRPPRRRAGLTQPSATPGAAFGRHEHAWPASLAGPCLRIWRTAAAQSVGSRTASERKPAADSRYASASAGTATRPVSSRSSINSGRIPCRLSARFRRERRASCGCGGGGRTGRYVFASETVYASNCNGAFDSLLLRDWALSHDRTPVTPRLTSVPSKCHVAFRFSSRMPCSMPWPSPQASPSAVVGPPALRGSSHRRQSLGAEPKTRSQFAPG